MWRQPGPKRAGSLEPDLAVDLAAGLEQDQGRHAANVKAIRQCRVPLGIDIDDLERVVASNLKERAVEANDAERIVSGEVGDFRNWLRSQQVVPTIRSLREHFVDVARAEVEKTALKIREVQASESEKRATEKAKPKPTAGGSSK